MKILRNAKSPKAQYYKFFKSGPVGTSSRGSSPSQRAAWSMNQSVPTASRHCCRQGDASAMFVMLGYNVAILCHDLGLCSDLFSCLSIFYTARTLLSPFVYLHVYFIFLTLLTNFDTIDFSRLNSPFSKLLPLRDLQKTLPKALRTQALTTLTSCFGLVWLV